MTPDRHGPTLSTYRNPEGFWRRQISHHAKILFDSVRSSMEINEASDVVIIDGYKYKVTVEYLPNGVANE